MVYEARSVPNSALDRCIAEQREAKAYLESDGPDKAGRGLGYVTGRSRNA